MHLDLSATDPQLHFRKTKDPTAPIENHEQSRTMSQKV